MMLQKCQRELPIFNFTQKDMFATHRGLRMPRILNGLKIREVHSKSSRFEISCSIKEQTIETIIEDMDRICKLYALQELQPLV